ncbi:hypothetical protein RhoFasGS6_04922 [Rhodococcus fascians]|uniref:restriction endonuclease subunit S n=1 Tax=Rhodococcoides fascians TaxID=1828 RepID=UPI001427C17D|nr:hypothetical protein [Rhodococcus fascians]
MFPTQQLRHLAQIRNGMDHSKVQDDSGAYPVYGSGGRFTSASSPLFCGPAVLLGRKGTIDKPLLVDGNFWTVDTMFCAQPHKQVDPRFLYYACTTIKFDMLSTSTALPSMTQTDLKAVRLPAPDFDTQIEVSAFLDRETTKIDALIAKQEQLIGMLRENRASTISKAVTRGLDPEVSTVVSDVAWLGSTPVHWRERRLKHVIDRIDSGTSVNGSDIPASADEIGVLKTSCVSRGQFQPDANKTVIDEDLGRITCQVKADSLIVNRANTPSLVGSAGYVGSPYPNLYLSDKLWQVTFDTALAEFVYYWTQTEIYRSQIAANCVGASFSMQNLSMADFRNISISIPPVDEQKAIVKHLAEFLKSVDTLVAKSTDMIATLREYRFTLITDAVTGKIDVRGVA